MRSSTQAQVGYRSAVIVLGALFLLQSTAQAARESDPTVQKLTELDGRLLRIERVLSNQSLLDQAQRVDALQNDLRAIRGSIEELQHSLENSQKQQRDLYGDLEKRLQALESSGRAAAPAPEGSNTAAQSAPARPAAAGNDREAYQAAFDLLKDGKYNEAIAALKSFQSNYPTSQLQDNALYWLGEAYYVGKDYPNSLASFKGVVERYPGSRKFPDALLKVGYCQYELKNWADAKTALNRVVREFGDTASAKLAAQRLAKIESEGH